MLRRSRLTPSFLRVVDANLNRAREGLRVCEEVARFVLGHSTLTRRLRQVRYELNRVSRPFFSRELFNARDAENDVGRKESHRHRGSHLKCQDLVLANARRVQEALRVLEEFGRFQSVRASQEFERLRFRVYTVERDLLSALSTVRHR